MKICIFEKVDEMTLMSLTNNEVFISHLSLNIFNLVLVEIAVILKTGLRMSMTWRGFVILALMSLYVPPVWLIVLLRYTVSLIPLFQNHIYGDWSFFLLIVCSHQISPCYFED